MLRKSLNAKFDVVWDEDPGFDKEHPDWLSLWDEYKTSGDASKLPIKEGQQVTKFRCQALGMEAMQETAMLAGQNNIRAYELAMRCGLKEVENYFVDDKPVKLTPQHFVDNRLTDTAMTLVYDLRIAQVVGKEILDRSVLDPTLGQV